MNKDGDGGEEERPSGDRVWRHESESCRVQVLTLRGGVVASCVGSLHAISLSLSLSLWIRPNFLSTLE